VSEHPRHIVCVTAFVTDQAGRLLLIESPRRGWEVPGGQVEQGEDLREALRREVEEESGIIIEAGPVVGLYSCLCEPTMLVVAFAATCVNGEPRASAESLRVEWVAREDALARVQHPPARMRLSDFLEGDDRVRVGSFRRNPFVRVS
jgi:8-oxo-dGTP diphosphatase